MTQITGKIYQQTNAAGTENRFPRTVMEAVLGLNSHLQQQFGALADIYMPIEGISESKPNQEFVFRKTPNTIKAKALTLDKIKGKTLAWNQLENKSRYEASKTQNGITFTNNGDGTVTVSGTASADASFELYWNNAFFNGHKFLFKGCPFDGSVSTYRIYVSGDHDIGSGLIIYRTSGALNMQIQVSSGTSFSNPMVFRPMIVDLTLMFGSGNEPSTVEEFEAMFPGYHDYSAGKLISNDASEIETVGRNVWDEEWENGTYDIDGKKANDGGSWVRCKNLIPVLPNTNYYVKSSQNMFVQFYDASGNFIYGVSGYDAYNRVTVTNSSFTTPSSAMYISMFLTSGYGTTYNNDICINLSDASFNGQYEPYRKSTLHIGLNNIRVKSHNIWDEEWEVGVYNDTTGEKVELANRIRCKNPIPISPSTSYYFMCGVSGAALGVIWYDANNQYISKVTATNITVASPANARYVTFYVGSVNLTTYSNNVCINVSSSFNGQYEPHGILTFNGVKSAGSVYDEIVENKYVKRVGSVDMGSLTWGGSGIVTNGFFAPLNDAKHVDWLKNCICGKYALDEETSNVTSIGDKHFLLHIDGGINYVYVRDSAFAGYTGAQVAAALSGVMLYYELATPIEYDLVEPLPTSMPAGTTEARISPNADGLSAPFCADITYGMGATEYAETAGVASFALNVQYAEVAARLLTPRTIWGQVFDGSANITGAMTGVSAIDSLMHFDTSNGRIGIGISTPLYNLDVAGTFHAAGNSVFGGTIDAPYARALLHSIQSSPTDWDTEATPVVEIQPFEISEAGNAAFEMVSVRDCLRLRYYSVDEHEFSDSDISFDGDHVSFENPLSAPRYDTSSDQRLKTNLSPVALTVEQIASAPAVEFNWVGNGQRGAGSIAQYWEEQLPYNVHDEGGTLSMEYGNIALISAIVCARKIQELEDKIKELEAKINV